MSKGYWAIRTYEAGGIGEKIKYWVPGEKPTKSARKLRSDIRKQKQNENDAVRRVARIIHANFRTDGYFVTLTYDNTHYAQLIPGQTYDPPEPEDCIYGDLDGSVGYADSDHSDQAVGAEIEEHQDAIWLNAHHQLQLCLRRVRRDCAQKELELAFLAFTSDMNGKTGEPVRAHHHLIVKEDALESFRKKWTAGRVYVSKLWRVPDQYGLAKYLMDQVRRIEEKKKYIPSRNLYMPAPKDRAAKTGNEVQPPRGAVILYRAEYKRGAPQYIRYIIPNKPDTGRGDRPKSRGGGRT